MKLLLIVMLAIPTFAMADENRFLDQIEKEWKTQDIDDCPKGYLEKVNSCEGEGVTGWQNSGQYFLLAKGIPKGSVCEGINSGDLENVGPPESKITELPLNAWNKTDCQEIGLQKESQCFYFDRPATNGNTHYYLFASFNKKCSKSIFFSGSRIRPEDIKEKLAN